MSDTPTASPVVLGRWEKPGNLASIAALAAAGQVTILPHELIRTTDGRVYHWTTSTLEIVSAPVHHGTVANIAALEGLHLLPSCTRGVHPGDTAYVTAAGCEYRVTAGINATATWSACAAIPTIPTTPSEVGADPSGTAATAVSTHNDATNSHADIRELIAGKQPSGSYLTTSTNYAGSSSPGGAATSALACTGNAATATKLTTARTLTIGAKSLSFDGTTDREYTIADIGALGSPDVGQWTPEITASTPPTGVTYNWRTGSYTRIGGVCYAWFGLSVSSLGSGGGSDLTLTGLPFVCRNTGAGIVWMPGGFFAGLVNAVDAYANAIGVIEGSNSAIFGRCNNLGMSAIPITDATNSLIVCGLIIYQTVT